MSVSPSVGERPFVAAKWEMTRGFAASDINDGLSYMLCALVPVTKFLGDISKQLLLSQSCGEWPCADVRRGLLPGPRHVFATCQDGQAQPALWERREGFCKQW